MMQSFQFTCEVCGSVATATRSDAIYCSSRCKQRAFNQRRREAEARLAVVEAMLNDHASRSEILAALH